MKKRKRLLLLAGMLGLTMFLAACSTGPISGESTGFWDRYIIFNFSQIIIWLSNLFGGNYGVGIIAFTLVVRIILLPVTYYQTKSSRKMTDIQPELKTLQEKHSSKDAETQELLRTETAKLYEDAGVNPAAGCLPLLIQMPVLIALYQSISRTEVLKSGDFLWANLGTPDPYFILPILAAILTLATSKLASMSQSVANPTTAIMTYMMPVMILFISITLPSAVSLYFVVSNGFSVAQTLLLNNPFKINRERKEKEEIQRKSEVDRQRAIRLAKKTKRNVKKK